LTHACTFAFASVQAWVKSGGVELLPRARAAVERGLTAGVADAQLAAGLLRLNEGDIEGGAAALADALARSPMSAVAHELVGRLMIEIDLIDAGVHHLETAAGLDAGRAQTITMDLARVDALRGDWEASERRVATLVDDPDPSIAQLGAMVSSRITAWRGDVVNAARIAGQLTPRFGERRGAFALLQRHLDGETFERAQWDAAIADLVDLHRPRRMMLVALQRCVEIALSIAQLGAAQDVLEKVTDLGLIDIVWMDRCPLLAPLAATERGRAVREVLATRAARLRDVFRPLA
jgi:eukaryotic-like serine/threonine-protein kinase